MTYTASEKLWGRYYTTFIKNIKTTNKMIYHYTSSTSIYEILSNQYIWFSNVNFLNDKTERKYIYNLLKTRVEKINLAIFNTFLNLRFIKLSASIDFPLD